jgi:hypothetical protein
LRQIMRTDFLAPQPGAPTGYERVLGLLEGRQKDLTNVEHEVYALVQKAVLVVSNGRMVVLMVSQWMTVIHYSY